jgi:predicted tellurium resistance membrane protein TerC
MHEHDTDPARERRGTYLGIFLTLLFTGGFLVFLIVVTGGFFLWAAYIVAFIFLFAGLHYLLWGWAMSQDVEGEREELEMQERAEAGDWDRPRSEHIRRF